MTEEPGLVFPDKIQNYDKDRDAVYFSGKAESGEIYCVISGEALDDHFETKGSSAQARLTAFQKHRADIEEIALQKYTARQFESDGSIFIRAMDVKLQDRNMI